MAACDPEHGYIAGRNGPCRPSDIRCVQRAWINEGRLRYYPDLGICARSHEDGGTIEPCPPGMGPPSGSRGPASRDRAPARSRNRATKPRGTRTTKGTGRRRTPPRPPRTPTLQEVTATCPSLPSPRLHRNPDREGVTGMETWLWADPHRSLTSTATIRGHRVTCTAVPEQWTFHTGDGASFSRSRPGAAPPRHAGGHVYQRKGAYTQRLVVRWRLQTSAGVTTTTRETSRRYRVVEIRGALVR